MGIFLLFYSNYIDVIGTGTATNDVDIISSRNDEKGVGGREPHT